MELLAVIKGLEALKEPCAVLVTSDSRYVVDNIQERRIWNWRSRGWRNSQGNAKNVDLWQRIIDLCEIHQVTMHWVRGHNGHIENTRCDKLATEASKW